MKFDARSELHSRSIRNGPECRKLEEIEEGMASALSKDAFNSGVTTVHEDRIKTFAQSHQLHGPKRSNPHNLI